MESFNPHFFKRPTPRPRPKEEVAIDVSGDGDDDDGKQEPVKRVYNPHRMMHAIVWCNLIITLVLGTAFIAFLLLRTSDTIVRNYKPQFVYFTLSGSPTLVQLPPTQFIADRVLSHSVCCLNEGSVTCNLALQTSITATALLRVETAAALMEPLSCKFSWTQHN
jgi:hypothetical protein